MNLERTNPKYYFYNDGNPQSLEDVFAQEKTGDEFEDAALRRKIQQRWESTLYYDAKKRIVLQEEVTREVTVSAVFTGIDFGTDPNSPVLYQIKIFGGAADGETSYASTMPEAIAAFGALRTKARVAEGLDAIDKMRAARQSSASWGF